MLLLLVTYNDGKHDQSDLKLGTFNISKEWRKSDTRIGKTN